MRIALLVVCFLAFGACPVEAQDGSRPTSLTRACVDFNKTVLDEVRSGRLTEAATVLSEALTTTADERFRTCEWVLLQDMAVVMSRIARLDESERYADRSIKILEKSYPPDDRVLLRPLHMLSSARLRQGKIAGAREAFERMQQIRINLPIDRALVYGTAATLLQAEGRHPEAEDEYLRGIAAWQESGLGDTSDAAALLNGLADLYISDGRFHEAGSALYRAVAIFAVAKDASPLDRIKVLNSQGVLHARLGQWPKAAEDLRSAIALADLEKGLNPAVLEPVLDNYARVLRENHQPRAAGLVETRIAALHALTSNSAVVDARDLLARSKNVK